MANLKNIKNKTYYNFMRVYNAMINEKHYSPADAEKLTRQVFDNWEDDKQRGARSIQYWYDVKLSREEYDGLFDPSERVKRVYQ